jgi:hypothetical protein
VFAVPRSIANWRELHDLNKLKSIDAAILNNHLCRLDPAIPPRLAELLKRSARS